MAAASGASDGRDDFTEALLSKLHRTSRTRFLASYRFEAKQKWSTYSITALSVYILTANVMALYGVPATVRQWNPHIACAGTIMSLVILVIGILEGARRYDLRSHQFHACGRKINQLYRELRIASQQGATAATLTKITRRYDKALEQYENHEPVDYLWYRQKNRKAYKPQKCETFRAHLAWYSSTYLPYHVAIFIPPLLGAWWLWKIFQHRDAG